MKTIYLTILFLTVSTIVLSQKPKFKKVSKDDLNLTTSSIDPNADAEYLYKGCDISFEYNTNKERFELMYEYHMRIKIYTDEGKKYADQVFQYYTGGGKNKSSEKIKKLSAYTFNLVNGKVKKFKLKKNGIYDEERNKFYNDKRIAMPEVQIGSVLDIRYTLESPFFFKVDEFFFQSDIPVRYTEFNIVAPEYFNYNYISKGLVPVKMDRKRGNGEISINYTVDTSDDPNSVKRVRKVQKIKYATEERKYHATNVAPIKIEPYVYTMNNYRSSVKIELLFTNFPDSPAKYYTTTWDEIAKKLSENSDFGGQLTKSFGDMDNVVAEANSMEREAKIAHIYKNVQNKFAWNGYSNEQCNKGIKSMIKTGSGNSAEINLLLVNLLQKAGIKAYPIVSKTSTSGFLNVQKPTLVDLDYVIAGVLDDANKLSYLDATDKNLPINMLPKRALNLKHVLIAGEIGKELPISNPNDGSISRIIEVNFDGDLLKGDIKQSIKGYNAYLTRNRYKAKEDLKKGLQTNNISTTDLSIENFDHRGESMMINGNVSMKGYVQEIDGKLLLDLNVGDAEFKNPLISETREFALFFDAKESQTDMVKINIPEGYTIESFPEKLNMSTPEKQATYMIEAKMVGDQLIVTRRSSIKSTIIDPTHYQAMKKLFDEVEAKLKEKIVLVKR